MPQRFLYAFFSLLVFCTSAAGQYPDFKPNLNGCLQRNEYQACKWALRYNEITAAQREQVEAKIKAIESGVVAGQRTKTPLDDLEVGFQKGTDIVGTIFQVIFGCLFLGFIVWVVLKLKTKAEIKAGAPDYQVIPAYDDGPMKVDISFQQIPAPNQKHRIYGGDNWWRMHMNVRMSNKDWALFQKSGLIENELFACHNSEFPEIEESFPGFGLKWMPAHRDFPNIARAEAAKEQLIRQLHIIRSRLDDMKSTGGGPERERIEI